ncbi:MAG: hypothetical protein ACK2VD_09290, partial [Anaerolineae bacterium]
ATQAAVTPTEAIASATVTTTPAAQAVAAAATATPAAGSDQAVAQGSEVSMPTTGARNVSELLAILAVLALIVGSGVWEGRARA